MVSELARGDWEDLRARGLEPTLDDFDRLNRLALRLADGAETTAEDELRKIEANTSGLAQKLDELLTMKG